MKPATFFKYFELSGSPRFAIALALASTCLVQSYAAARALRVLSTAPGKPLLTNGDFETKDGEKPARWAPAPNGCSVAPDQGVNASAALVAENSDTKSWSGASQTLGLNQENPAPLRISGWSKAKDISGSRDSGYSLYVDLVYRDGTTLWGQTANFPTGTHDWVRRELTIIPQKAVKSLTIYCILRGHSGTALFDNISVEELGAQGDTTLFQGVPVAVDSAASGEPAGASKKSASRGDGTLEPGKRQKHTRTADGLDLSWEGAAVQLAAPYPQPSALSPVSGFLARDVTAGSDFHTFTNDRCPDLNLALKANILEHPDHIEVQGRLSDLSGKDRAITLAFCLPISAEGWTWGDDINHSRVISGKGDFANLTAVPCGAAGAMSLYPIAAVASKEHGLALGLDMAAPAVYRVGYHAGLRLLYIAYDFGLVPETRNFPSAADFKFVIYRFDPAWGFRAAFDKFTHIFPEHFKVRSPEQGIWMPFTDISTVQDWQDFGFKYHEGNNNVPWDDAHGILSFRYTEPMTWWMRMNKAVPRTFEQAIKARDDIAQNGNGHNRDQARVAQVAGMFDESGDPSLQFKNEPWCDGAVWSINPNPFLAPGPQPATPNSQPELNGGTIHWNPQLKESLYGSKAKATLDGEYLDSLEGYVTTDLNFRREHFAYTTVPLCFSADDHRPTLFKGLAIFEFTKWISDDVHRLDRLMFANGVPYRFGFLCPWLDVLGTETDWVRNGRYQPVADTLMAYWRTLSCRKPYVLLMNTDYDTFDFQMVERYFQHSLFYGFYPSMFSHNAAENPYWQNPKWYNRDRPLFKKYLPVIKTVAQAGWQPVTHARSSNPAILVERFGPDSTGTHYFTIFNDSEQGQQGAISIENTALNVRSNPQGIDLLSQTPVRLENLSLEPQQALAIGIKSN